MVMADDMRALLLRFAALRNMKPREWPEDDRRFNKCSPELLTPIPSNARPDDLARMAITYGLAGKDIVARHYAAVAFHKAEQMARVHARAFRPYRKLARRTN